MVHGPWPFRIGSRGESRAWRAASLAVGVGAVKRGALAYGGDVRGLNVAVVGAGTIGNCVAQAAKAMCAARVLLTDISTARLRFAEECGVEHCAATLQVSLSDAITAVFGSRRADIIVDAVGAPAVMGEILAAARRSSAVVVTGNFKEPLTFEVPVIQRQEIALIGHMMYVKEDFEDAIRFIAEGSVKVGGLVTQRFPAAKLKDAFRLIDLQPHHVMKVLLTF